MGKKEAASYTTHRYKLLLCTGTPTCSPSALGARAGGRKVQAQAGKLSKALFTIKKKRQGNRGAALQRPWG